MRLTYKDAVATVATGLAVLAFFANRGDWGVPLVGGSVRWTAGAVMALGWVSCAAGQAGEASIKYRQPDTWLLTVLGVGALVFAILALATGSATMLALLIADFVLLWAGSTLRHLLRAPGQKSVAA
jgi:hypothetical protein